MSWSVERLSLGAKAISASRRTDIPALFGAWFERRLEEGFAEYVPAGPPRRLRASLRPEDVTHFNFWTKWPRPFFRPLSRVLELGYPVLMNVTITGLGGSPIEPNVPSPERCVEAVRELARMVPARAILWRYDPVVLSSKFDRRHHVAVFSRLVGALEGSVDRVVTSFVSEYGRRVRPDLVAFERESGSWIGAPTGSQGLEVMRELSEISRGAGIPFSVCCAPSVRALLGCDRGDCGAWSWACRAYPELARHRPLASRPMRPDCGCSKELDIGVYDTCTLGCRYSYGSANQATAKRRFQTHDPSAPCILP